MNNLGVSSIKLREMGGALAMRASRAAKRMTPSDLAPQYEDEEFDIPEIVDPNPRNRRREMNTGARSSVFNRRPGTTPVNSRQTRTMLQDERGRAPAAPVSKEKQEWIKVMTSVDKQNAKVAILSHRVDGLAEQVQKKGKDVDVDSIMDDIEELAEKLEELQDIIKEMHDSTHFFYATTTQKVPCMDEPSFDGEDAPGYIGEGEKVMLVSPQQTDGEGNVWIRARRIDDDAQIREYWVPMAGEEDDDYFVDFEL